MKVRDLLDTIEMRLRSTETGDSKAPDRLYLLYYLQLVIESLQGMDEFDFFQTWVEPLIALSTGKRDYPLPADFGHNFVIDGDKFVCLLSDGTNSRHLSYLPTKDFFIQDLEGESNGRPKRYTVVTNAEAGTREIWLSPPPDSAATYTIKGLYVPSWFDMENEDQYPVVPYAAPYLTNATLALIQPENPIWQQKADEALVNLHLRVGRDRRVQPSPSEDVLRSSQQWLRS